MKRQLRQRKEYLFKLAQKKDKKLLLDEALEKRSGANKKIRTTDLIYDVDLEMQDDEYAYLEPNSILLTTSRSPSSTLLQFVKELSIIFPKANRVNRGNSTVEEIMQVAKQKQITDVIIIHETRGVPDTMTVSHLPNGPTLRCSIHNVVSRHQVQQEARRNNSQDSQEMEYVMKNVPQSDPFVISNNFKSKVGGRVSTILKAIFPEAPNNTTFGAKDRRIITISNEQDLVLFRHHVVKKRQFWKEENNDLNESKDALMVIEVGPRFDLKPFEIRRGTIDLWRVSDIEWVFRPYQRTAFKRSIL
eukprot:NODE_130_length_16779_cov_1.687410.p5 type:complete len:303 gc:universal NODE_130_length_16779_cov_1.687410:11027-11935(+)